MSKKNIGLAILFSTVFIGLNAQSYKEKLYQSFTGSRMNDWEKIISDMQNEYLKTKNDRQLYNIIEAYYGFIGYCITIKNYDKMEKYIDKGEEYIDFLIKKYPKWAEIYAMKGAWYGFRMSAAPYKAVYLGSKSIDNINKALALDNNCPNAHIEKANAEFHMPSVFGGSKTLALKHYQMAVSLFEKQGNDKNNWLYLNTMLNLAQSYELLNNFAAAINIYQKILSIAPQFLYVKNTLLPSALKKVK